MSIVYASNIRRCIETTQLVSSSSSKFITCRLFVYSIYLTCISMTFDKLNLCFQTNELYSMYSEVMKEALSSTMKILLLHSNSHVHPRSSSPGWSVKLVSWWIATSTSYLRTRCSPNVLSNVTGMYDKQNVFIWKSIIYSDHIDYYFMWILPNKSKFQPKLLRSYYLIWNDQLYILFNCTDFK